MKFISDELKKERERDKIQEILDYVRKSKSNADILLNYIQDERKNYCDPMYPSEELLDRLGIAPYDKEARILYILEKHFESIKATQSSWFRIFEHGIQNSNS